MNIETHGRARLEVKDNHAAILVFDKLSDDVHKTPRPVKHVGTEKYIRTIWNKIKKKDRYLKDKVWFPN